MTDRFSLRFASGEREGESVPIPAPRATLGRRAGNTLQVQDGSISGQHAEFVIEAGSVTLRDLGSTNGTRVSGRKISELQLAHGDSVVFGSIEAVFLDAELSESSTAGGGTRRAAASEASAGEQVERISADKIARAGKGSKTGLLVGLLLVVGGGGAAAFFLLGGQGGGGRKVSPPPVVQGDLLKGGDFEGEQLASNWTVESLGAADFVQQGSARATGRDGLRSSLEGAERARVVSDPVNVSAGKILRLTASLRARDGGGGRVGIEFLPTGGSEDDTPGGTTAWSETVVEVTQHQDIELEAPVPPGVRSARVVLEAMSSANEGGSVDVDDVSLVAQGGGATPAARVGEFTLWLLGNPEQSATLYKVSKPLFGDMRGVSDDPRRAPGLSKSSPDGGIGLSASGAEGLSLRVEPEALRQGLASLGAGGYLEHSPGFERKDATSLLLAEGKDLVALHFSGPVHLTSRLEGAGVRVHINGAAATSCVLQLDFSADRAESGNLAFDARKFEKDGQFGACLSSWNKVLTDYPFDLELVAEAREVRARLVQTGREELETVAQSFERAKFFRLLDLFRLCRTNATLVAEKFAGSEVEAQATQLVGEIETALAGLETDLSRDEIARLQSILRVLEATESPRLAGEVRGYLNAEYGVGN